jgi:hypothetical protein
MQYAVAVCSEGSMHVVSAHVRQAAVCQGTSVPMLIGAVRAVCSACHPNNPGPPVCLCYSTY